MTLREYVREIKRGKLSAAESLQSFQKKCDEYSHLNAFITLLNERAMQRAGWIDEEISRGADPGPLAGTIFAIKDNINIAGVRTSCASRILENFNSPFDATVIRKLTDAGAVFIGKTNMDEFAMGSSNENSYFGNVKNSVDESRVPGGSSGGSAVAVAAGMAQAALGSDTGGSIRQPAAFSGVVGLKPTYGRVSRFGLVAFASSLDQIGPLTGTVDDAALILGVISGHDERDSTSSREPVPDFHSFINRDIRGIRIGVNRAVLEKGIQPEIGDRLQKLTDYLQASGAEIVEISLEKTLEFGIAAYYIIATAEASSNLARFDGVRYGYRDDRQETLAGMYRSTRQNGFGEEVRRRIMLGTYVLSSGYYDAYYKKALQVRHLIKKEFDEAFGKVDTILTPTTPATAFAMGEKISDPLEMYLSDIFTVSANLAGICGINVPVGMDASGLPIGVQFMANAFEEGKLFRVADFVEKNFK